MATTATCSQPQLKNRRHKIYLPADVAKHSKPSECWVTYKGRVYDVTSFLNDHPGGDDLILRYAGKDVETIMNDAEEHAHSDAAFDMLSEFQIGLIGTEETIVRDDIVIGDDFHPEETEVGEDYRKNQFLDLEKPLIMQVWRANFSKAFYLQQVHQPRHLPHPARLFGPWYLEMFTRTNWYVVPIVWLPVAAAIFYRSLQQQSVVNAVSGDVSIPSSAWSTTIGCFLFGNFIWTFLEYLLHRFLFHVDDILPDNGAMLTLHFLLHGIHHYVPMDKLRLVMPPLLFFVLSYPFTQLAHSIFPAHIANGIISGAFVFYVFYDLCHYSLHHVALPQYLREMKKYHMAHHFKNFELGFGVTSKFWDYIFGTTLRM